jgi:hypothetical protein
MASSSSLVMLVITLFFQRETIFNAKDLKPINDLRDIQREKLVCGSKMYPEAWSRVLFRKKASYTLKKLRLKTNPIKIKNETIPN